MLFPVYSILFAAAASAIAFPKVHHTTTAVSASASATSYSVTVSSATRPGRYAPAPNPTQVIQNPGFEVASANADGYVNQQTPWGRSSTDSNDFDMSGLVSNDDAPFATPYGSEYYMFAPTSDSNIPSLRQAISSLIPGAIYNVSYAYNFHQAILSQPAKASTVAFAATVSIENFVVDTLQLTFASVDEAWHTHSFLYTVPAKVGSLGAEFIMGWGVVADPAKVLAGTQFAVDQITFSLEEIAALTTQ